MIDFGYNIIMEINFENSTLHLYPLNMKDEVKFFEEQLETGLFPQE